MQRVARGDRILGFVEGTIVDGIVYHFTPNLIWIELLTAPDKGGSPTATRSKLTAIVDRRHTLKI